MRILRSPDDDYRSILRKRAIERDVETEQTVASLIADVRRRGDAALREHGRRFDSPFLDRVTVGSEEIAGSRDRLDEATREALEDAYRRVLRFHELEFARLFGALATDRKGIPHWSEPYRSGPDTGAVGQRFVPLESVGLYVPGGGARYPSSVIMTAAPAIAAGVRLRTVATPAQRDGRLDLGVLTAIEICDIAQTIKMGGASAVAAMAFGTETITRVDKIVGPGNRWVNEAKRQVWGYVGVDGYAGPSEVCVFATKGADARFAAADLLTQIEHAPDNAGFLVSDSEDLLHAILAEIERQCEDAPRGQIMRCALANESLGILVRDLAEAVEVVNLIAPEHLTLIGEEAERVSEEIVTAGCILIGDHTPESAADFCLGPSHTLPTSGAGRWQGALNVLDFIKVQSVARLSKADLSALLPTIEAIGSLEGFPGHVRGATMRFD